MVMLLFILPMMCGLLDRNTQKNSSSGWNELIGTVTINVACE